MLSEAVKGLTLSEVKDLSNRFHDMMQGTAPTADQLSKLGDLGVMAKVREFPVRIKCALLAWSALDDGIDMAER